jgi:hypothetical protein
MTEQDYDSIRRQLIGALQDISILNPNRELSLVKTKIQEAIMWLEWENKINFNKVTP